MDLLAKTIITPPKIILNSDYLSRNLNTLYIPRPIFRPYLKVNIFIFYGCKRLIKQAGFIVGF